MKDRLIMTMHRNPLAAIPLQAPLLAFFRPHFISACPAYAEAVSEMHRHRTFAPDEMTEPVCTLRQSLYTLLEIAALRLNLR